MKGFDGWLEQLFRWLDRYAWTAVLFFSLGAVFTALAAEGQAWVELFGVLTALGTLAAAFAALGATAATRSQLRQQLERESEEKRPNVRVIDTGFSEAQYFQGRKAQERTITISIANMSAAPILVTEVHVWSDEKLVPTYELVSIIILAGGRKNTRSILFPVYPAKGGNVSIYFQYSATGPVLHRLTVPYEVRNVGETSFDFPFSLNDQCLESNSDVEASLERVHKFYNENPDHVSDTRPSSAGTEQKADSSANDQS